MLERAPLTHASIALPIFFGPGPGPVPNSKPATYTEPAPCSIVLKFYLEKASGRLLVNDVSDAPSPLVATSIKAGTDPFLALPAPSLFFLSLPLHEFRTDVKLLAY